jgi:hypothetical protein
LTGSGGQVSAVAGLNNIHQLSGAKIMSKERNSKKEGKKKSALTSKEKKAAKKSKKESKVSLALDKTR